MLRGIIPTNGGGGDVTALTARVTTLENIQYEYEVFTSIASGTSATITFPTGSALVVGEYAGQNAIVTVLDASGRPIDQAAKTAAGAVITATLTVGGTYTLSGTPSAYPVGLVYQLRCSAKDAGNIPLTSIIDAIQIEGTMAKQDANAVAITGGAIDAATIGATTAATVRGTTVTATTQFSGPGTGLTGTASGLSIGGNAATATTATNLSGGTVSATTGVFSRNISIGTTPKAWVNQDRVLEVSSFTSVSQQSNGASNFGFNFVETGANAFSYASTDEACRFSAITDGGFAWFQAASGTLNSAITFTQAMTLAPSGNLGIGIALPAYPLVVNAAASSQIQIRAGNTSDSALLFGDPDAPAIGRITYAHATDSMSFMVNGSNRAIIDSSGNLALGVTPSAWGGGYRGFDLGLYCRIYSANGGPTGFAANAHFNGANWVYYNTTVASRYEQSLNGSVAHAWFTAPSGTAGATTSVTSGQSYIVTALGASTLAQWQANFSGLSALPTVGQTIACTATGTLAGGGAVTQIVAFNQAMAINTSGNLSIGEATDAGPRIQAYQVNPTRGVVALIANRASSSQTGSQLQFSQTGIADWTIGQPAGANAFAFWSGRGFGTDGSELMRLNSTGQLLITSLTGAVGYGAGSGGSITQATSRTTGVTLNRASGSITLFSAAGTSTPTSFTVTNSLVGVNDVIYVAQRSGTNLYRADVTAIAAGSFTITFSAITGTAVDAPVLNFVVIKGSTT